MARRWEWLNSVSIVQGPLYTALVVGTFAGLAALLLLGRGRHWWRLRVPLAVLSAGALLGGYWLLLAVTKPWPDPLPLAVWLWIGMGLLGLTLLAAGWRHRLPWRVRGLGALAALLVVAGAADGVDAVYGSYPTLASALQLPPPHAVPAGTVVGAHRPVFLPAPGKPLASTWRAPAGMPSHGVVFSADIRPTRSGFAARPAWVYLPPAYLTARRPLLPVLMLIGGQPGSPRDWLNGGRLAERMDAWAATHAGLTPIVVMPDALGGPLANSLCMDSRLARADTYLSKDVVAWVSTHLQADPHRAHWAVGGMSFGGTCALQLAVAHPGLFPTLFDAEGQRGPTLGSHADTVAATFGGNEAAFDAVDPLHELAARRYPTSAAVFVAGAQDHVYGPQQQQVASAARAAGMTVSVQLLPGGHSWSVSGPALTADLPWLTARMGLTTPAIRSTPMTLAAAMESSR